MFLESAMASELEYVSIDWAQGPPKLSSGSPRTLTGAPELVSGAKADIEGRGGWKTRGLDRAFLELGLGSRG